MVGLKLGKWQCFGNAVKDEEQSMHAFKTMRGSGGFRVCSWTPLSMLIFSRPDKHCGSQTLGLV